MMKENTRRRQTQGNKNNRHAEESLLSISTALRAQGRDPEQKRLRMTLWNHGAFTLIELLVVVLIIGILAAVALPQYQKAVKKQQGKEVILAVHALDEALSSYYLTHGDYYNERGITQRVLDVEIPSLKYFQYTTCGTTGRTPAYEFQAGSRVYDQINVSFFKDNYKMDVFWEKGKRVKVVCPKQLSDYFHGKWEVGVGTSGSYKYWVVDEPGLSL